MQGQPMFENEELPVYIDTGEDPSCLAFGKTMVIAAQE